MCDQRDLNFDKEQAWMRRVSIWVWTMRVSIWVFVLWFLFLASFVVVHAEPPVRLVSIEEERELNAMLPTLNYDALGSAAISSGELIWYADKEMPPAYQLQNSFHSPFYNVSSENEQDLSGRRIGKDRIGNGNRDFPWVTTGGTDNCADVEIFRFVRFPKDDYGNHLPLVYFIGANPGSGLRNPNNTSSILGEGGGAVSSQRWLYPRGTVFGELMCMQGPDDMLYPFELRMRFREREYWEVDVYRPYTTAKELEHTIKELRPVWWEQDDLVKFLNALRNPKVEKGSVQDRNRDVIAFRATFKKHELPPLPDAKLVAQLLTTASWKSAQGAEWIDGVTSPTAPKGTKFHVVPEEYAAHITAVDSKSCMECHKHTGFNVRVFDQNRGWYGRIRGNDGIFTFHPIDPSSISYDGTNKPIVMRPAFVKAGLVAAYNPRVHTADWYKQLKQ